MQPAVHTDFTQYLRSFKLLLTRSFLTEVYFDNEKENARVLSPVTAKLCLPMLPLGTWMVIGKTGFKSFGILLAFLTTQKKIFDLAKRV